MSATAIFVPRAPFAPARRPTGMSRDALFITLPRTFSGMGGVASWATLRIAARFVSWKVTIPSFARQEISHFPFHLAM